MNFYTIVKVEKGTGRIVGFLSARQKRWLHSGMQKQRFKALKEVAEKKLESLNATNQNEKYYYKMILYGSKN